MLIGYLKEKYQELKIKEIADHVGLSVPLVSSNHGLCLPEEVSVFLNNNLLIAQLLTEITDVTEDGHQVPLTTLKLAVLPLKLNIHMQQRTKIALKTEEASN
jgi:hypothetical protein